ncbi:DUF309 domain-containing protein [Sporosarcina sp. HYO08]|uniref:DUF309 domain-containing protein n=1 Tax=Sporosarcina sp. HYO08 TaxID=1759557 RepID=UPI0007985984|nr:DUF309 domain-containing protein [Sporosarcina sp. HYO08]KXH82058.1 hypothetical protein AU377_07340 [Sporosarcina sp. HYO08]
MHPYHHPLFVKFIVYFNENQDFFECHEVLEEYWKSLPNSDKQHPLTAFILLSTGMYHWRRRNFTGAEKTLQKAVLKFMNFKLHAPDFTEEIDMHQLIADAKLAFSQSKERSSFSPFPIHVSSATLASHVNEMVTSIELLPFGSDAVIHKHMLRDRSDILRKREEKKKSR